MFQCPLGLIPHFYEGQKLENARQCPSFNALSGLYLISTVPLQKPRFYAVSRAYFCRYLSGYSDRASFPFFSFLSVFSIPSRDWGQGRPAVWSWQTWPRNFLGSMPWWDIQWATKSPSPIIPSSPLLSYFFIRSIDYLFFTCGVISINYTKINFNNRILFHLLQMLVSILHKSRKTELI